MFIQSEIYYEAAESDAFQPTLNLRFVNRDGRLILQQQFVPLKDSAYWWEGSGPEWRDVPAYFESAVSAKAA